MKQFRVIHGGLALPRPIVDTWCGERFADPEALHAHWAENPDCRRNALVSNQTQSKYGPMADEICICGHSRHAGRCFFPGCRCS